MWALDRLDWFLYRSEPDETHEQTRSIRPNHEAPAGYLVTRAERALGTELSDKGHYVAELGTHYAIGIGPAVGYALLRDSVPLPGPAKGALFGAAMWLLEDEGLNRVLGLTAPLAEYPWQDHARGLASHILYGLITDAALNVMRGRPVLH